MNRPRTIDVEGLTFHVMHDESPNISSGRCDWPDCDTNPFPRRYLQADEDGPVAGLRIGQDHGHDLKLVPRAVRASRESGRSFDAELHHLVRYPDEEE